MSSAIPRSVREEAGVATVETQFEGPQKHAIKQAIEYCRAAGLNEGDYGRLLKRVEQDMVLRQHDRHELSSILSTWMRETESSSKTQQLASWAKSDLWEANRLEGEA